MKEVKRPWGEFKQFVLNKKCTVKIMIVNPHQELSLQKHRRRVEEWYFLSSGVVQLGNRRFRVDKNQTVIVKKNMPHRVIANSKKVEFLEISKGNFSEGDEVRMEDRYGRKVSNR